MSTPLEMLGPELSFLITEKHCQVIVAVEGGGFGNTMIVVSTGNVEFEIIKDRSLKSISVRWISGAWHRIDWILEYFDSTFESGENGEARELWNTAKYLRTNWQLVIDAFSQNELPSELSRFIDKKLEVQNMRRKIG